MNFNQAVEDLTFGIITVSLGIAFILVDKSTNNYQEFKQTKPMQISREGADTSIYGNRYINLLARAWHDHLHLRHHKSFSEEDELFIARQQRGIMFNTLVLNGIPKERARQAADLIFADIYEQVKYYYKHNEYVPDQISFIKDHFGIQ